MSLTIAGMKSEFDIEFVGEGWYGRDGDWILIQGCFLSGKLGAKREDNSYRLYCWSHRDPRKDLAAIINLPERMNEKSLKRSSASSRRRVVRNRVAKNVKQALQMVIPSKRSRQS